MVLEQNDRSFLQKIRALEGQLHSAYANFPTALQNAIILRRLAQLVRVCRVNPMWRTRISNAIGDTEILTFDAFRAIPIMEKDAFSEFFSGTRCGLVSPIETGGFLVASSGGTSSGRPSEIVYALDELSETYEWAGDFIGRHLLPRHFYGPNAGWVGTTLADSDLWSSGTMVGGVLQKIPGANYLGIGPMSPSTFQRVLSNPGPKCLMGISRDIAALVDLARDIPLETRETLQVVLYGSGSLTPRAKEELREAYPNVAVLSFFAATQAETIGLQLESDTETLTAIPGLHFIEIVKENGEWAAVGEEGDLVITRLFGDRAPVLRLRLGDRVRRLADRDEAGLKSVQFSYVGRSGDFIDVADSRIYAPRFLSALFAELRDSANCDLDQYVTEVQLQTAAPRSIPQLVLGSRSASQLSEVIFNAHATGQLQQSIVRALMTSTEGSVGSLASLGDRSPACDLIQLVAVTHGSEDIHRTELGKTPVVHFSE